MLDPTMSSSTPEQVSIAIMELAEMFSRTVPDSPQKSTGLRKLMQAKDAFLESVPRC